MAYKRRTKEQKERIGDAVRAAWARKKQSAESEIVPTHHPSDGSTASYYVLPDGSKELQDLIAYRNMNSQMGEIFRAAYRYGLCPHSPKIREIKKIIFYAQAELERLERYENADG